MPKDPNEVGAAWRKTSVKGERYLSLSLNLDALLAATGGAVNQVNLMVFPIVGEKANEKAPDFRVKFFPKDGERAPAAKPAAAAPLLDDDIPF